MPTFDCEVDVDDFMNELSESEIKEVIEWRGLREPIL
jgi:hypothetical protein